MPLTNLLVSLTPGTYLISDNQTVPKGMTLHFQDGAILSIANGKILTVNGVIQAPECAIFAGLGRVLFGSSVAGLPNLVNARWWGAAGDGMADDTVALAAAFLATSGTASRVLLAPGTYQPYGWASSGSVVRGTVINGTAYAVPALPEFEAVCNYSGACTITLPAVPVNGQKVTVIDAYGSAGAIPITINGNGVLIRGAATLAMGEAYGSVLLTYDSVIGQWYAV